MDNEKRGRRRHSPTEKRLTFSFTAQDIAAITDLADGQAVSLTDAARRAIARDKFLMDAVRGGSDLLLRDATGNVREIVIVDFEPLRQNTQ